MKNKMRWEIVADLIKKYNLRNVVEVGVDEGVLSKYVVKECSGVLKSYTMVDIVYRDDVKKFVDENPVCHFINEPSVDAAKNIQDRSLDLVFIDATHKYEQVIEDIEAWLPKIKPNGIIAGHDYGNIYSGVMRAVKERFQPFYLEVDWSITDYLIAIWYAFKEEGQ